MVDPDNKVVIIDVNGHDAVLYKASGSEWTLDSSLNSFNNLISELGSIEVNGVQNSNIVTFTVDEVDYSFNTSTYVITPDLEVE